jgi:alkaline phosphatase D
LLDTRTFRSLLKTGSPTTACRRVNHVPNTDPGATILGADQWSWLQEELREAARLRIIASSIQVIPDQHCYKIGANFPNERDKLLRAIRESAAAGVIFISGDRHLAEISRLPASIVGYPLYEITSSGMNSAGAGEGEENRYPANDDRCRGDNFGVIAIEWPKASPLVRMQVRDARGVVVRTHEMSLDERSAVSPPPP